MKCDGSVTTEIHAIIISLYTTRTIGPEFDRMDGCLPSGSVCLDVWTSGHILIDTPALYKYNDSVLCERLDTITIPSRHHHTRTTPPTFRGKDQKERMDQTDFDTMT